MAERVGQRLGNYRLLRLIGKGGFAEVYQGEHVRLHTQAALKVLHTRLASADEIEGFQQEAQTIAKLVHPHIVRVLDFDVEDDTPFLVMDFAANGTLRQKHPKGTRLALETITPYVRQAAEALHYAHERKLIHRDIKPENLLLDENDAILLSDFGIALIAQSSRYQNTQEVVGTMAYMAPEQLQGHPRPASDQYALAITVYEWLTGDRPFHGSFSEIFSQQMFVAPAPLREKLPTLAPAIEEVVLTALAKDPKERFGSVRAFATAFEQASQNAALHFAPTQFITPSAPLARPTNVITLVDTPGGRNSVAAAESVPPGWRNAGAPAPAAPATSIHTPPAFSSPAAAGASAPPAKKTAPKRRGARGDIIIGSLVCCLLLLVIAGATWAELHKAPGPFHQQITTGPHITSIVVGTGFDDIAQTITGAKDTFKSGLTVYVAFTVFNAVNQAEATGKLSYNDKTIQSFPLLLADGLYTYYFSSTVTGIGTYTWEISYQGTLEASITFQVIS